jgi:hypothetical protein
MATIKTTPKKPRDITTLNVRQSTKSRLVRLIHVDQSVDSLVNELMDAYERSQA